MTTLTLSSGLIAPSQKLANLLGKLVRDSLPQNNGKVYQTKVTFHNIVEYQDKKFSTNALTPSKACQFVCQIAEGTMMTLKGSVMWGTDKDRQYFMGEKSYSLQGWVEVDWDKTKKVDIFYEVLGNVVRDPKTAVAMLLL